MSTQHLLQAGKAVGILGGVAPEAGCMLHQYLIKETQIQLTAQSDQEHLETFHLALPQGITDRTDFLQNLSSLNPALGAFEVMKLFDLLGEARDETIVVGIPSNTFHVPEIFEKLKLMINILQTSF